MQQLLILCDHHNREFMTNILDADLKVGGLYQLSAHLEGLTISNYAKIVACGSTMAAMLGFDDPIKDLRTQDLGYMGIPVQVTKSPAAMTHDKLALLDMGKDIHKAFASVFGIAEVDLTFTQTHTCTSATQIRELHELAKHTGRLAVDCETKGGAPRSEDDKPSPLDRERCIITCISLSAQVGHSLVVPIDHFERKADAEMGQALKDLFYDADIEKVLQNAHFDLFIFLRYGWTFRGVIHDTKSLHHQLYNYKPHGLKDMVTEYFPSIAGYELSLAQYNNKWDIIPWNKLSIYAGIDADVTLRFSYIFEDMLVSRDPKEYLSYRNLMSAGLKPLLMAEWHGCRIDKPMLASAIVTAEEMLTSLKNKMRQNPAVIKWESVRHKERISDAIAECRAKINSLKTAKAKAVWEAKLIKAMEGDISPTEINFSSPAQVQELLYHTGRGFEFDTPQDYEPKENKRSISTQPTDKYALEGLPDETGFIDMLLVYRGVSKTLSTYLKSILDKTDESNYVHGQFNLTGTKTFRLSASEPNLQNVISRSKYEEVMNIVACVKRAFLPDPDEVLLVVDYQQAELRIIAHHSGDTNMLAAYNAGKDLHTVGACDTLRITEEEFHQKPKAEQKSLRQKAKATNFGLIYDMSAKGFQTYARRQYGVILTLEEAEEVRMNFFRRYPYLLTYHNDMQVFADLNGYVPTLFGSRCYLPDLMSTMKWQHKEYYSKAMRNAINSPIQGTAGQLTLFAIALLHNRIHPSVKIVNTVHDSILFSVPKHLLRDTLRIVEDTMVNPPLKQYFGVELSVKLAVDFEASLVSWKDAVPINEFLEANPSI